MTEIASCAPRHPNACSGVTTLDGGSTDHPNICVIHEISETDDDQLYLVMAHYEGETLKERIARGPLELGVCAAETVRQL